MRPEKWRRREEPKFYPIIQKQTCTVTRSNHLRMRSTGHPTGLCTHHEDSRRHWQLQTYKHTQTHWVTHCSYNCAGSHKHSMNVITKKSNICSCHLYFWAKYFENNFLRSSKAGGSIGYKHKQTGLLLTE